jgi:hypothetical protein
MDLIHALSQGDIAIVMQLLAAGQDPNTIVDEVCKVTDKTTSKYKIAVILAHVHVQACNSQRCTAQASTDWQWCIGKL